MGYITPLDAMKKRTLFSLFLTFLFSLEVNAQCNIELETDTLMPECGDSAHLEVKVEESPDGENFNDQALDSSWDASSGMDLSNPCSTSLDNSTYLWMGSSSAPPRYLSTPQLNMQTGGQVCFELKMEHQNNVSPCEGADLPDEGVHLQYSTDDGSSWTDIYYFNPDTACCGCNGGCGGLPPSPFVDWDQYCVTIPPNAQTDSTRFRWLQNSSSGSHYDHWGLDNISFSVHLDSNLEFDWGNGFSDQADTAFLPTDSSWVELNAVQTTTGDSCIDSTYVGYQPLDPHITPSDPLLCNSDSMQLSAHPYPPYCSFQIHTQDTAGDGWQGASLSAYLNGTPLTTLSANGHKSIDTILVGPNDSLRIDYNSGTNDSHNLYHLIDPMGDTVFSDGPSPQIGIAFNDTVGCTRATGYEFDWSPGGMTSDSSAQSPYVHAIMPGTLMVHLQDSVHSFCQGKDTVTVDTGSGAQFSLGPDTSFCGNGTLALFPDSIDSSYSLLWNDSLITDTLRVDSSYGSPSQEHVLTAIKSKECRSSDSIQVDVLDFPWVDLGNDTSTCRNDSLLLDGGNYPSHLWQDGSGDQTYLIDGSQGTGIKVFHVTATMANGCTASDSIKVKTHSVPPLQLGDDQSLCANDTLTLTSPYPQNIWDNGLSGNAHLIDTAHAGLGTSEHWVIARDSNECENRDTVSITFELCTSIDEVEGVDEEIRVFPNPVKESFQVELSEEASRKLNTLQLFTVKGKAVFTQKLDEEEQSVKVPTADLAPGTYHLRIKGKEARYGKKMIVE